MKNFEALETNVPAPLAKISAGEIERVAEFNKHVERHEQTEDIFAAVVIDERFNGGGQLADYIIDYLRRPQLNFFTMREGQDITTPQGAIFGPKVMIINEMAGSGGDAMPWMFRKTGIGPLIGKRTWGGLVGHYTNPADLLDGGFTGTPNLAFYNLEGKWEVENHGVPPDIEVEMDPKALREGHDPQLEKAVAVVMEMLKKNPPPTYKRPAYPDYHKQR